MRLGSKAHLACLAAAALTGLSGNAEAQSCLPAAGATHPPLCRNNFNIDLYQGPVLAPLRVTALGGAYAALAEGVDALGQNAAASAVRASYSSGTFDYDITVGFDFPGAFGQTDFDNRGEVGLNSTTFFYTVGALVQQGRFGVGAIADFQRFTLSPQKNSNLPASVIQIARIHVSAGYNFFGDQLTVGGGVRAVRATVDQVAPGASEVDFFVLRSTNVLTMIGLAPEFGAVVHPDYTPWRVGLTYRPPVSASGEPNATVTTDSSGVRRSGGVALPSAVHWPWELEVGAALNAGPRPLNPVWLDPRDQDAQALAQVEHARRARQSAQRVELDRIADPAARKARETEFARAERFERSEEDHALARLSDQLKEERVARYLNWPRARILVVAEALITGPSTDGIGLQSFLRQEDVQSGGKVNVQPRLGIEGEPVADKLVARVGTYIEPSRYAKAPSPGVLAGARQHFTFGLEMRLLSWDVFGLARNTRWTIAAAGDLAPRYQNLGLSVGTWH